MRLVEAIKVVQEQTRQVYPARSVVGQYLVSVGADDKHYKFRTICRNAERMGLIKMGTGLGGEWITLA
jgi:hypothetical protein